jgi:hypothetical protein
MPRAGPATSRKRSKMLDVTGPSQPHAITNFAIDDRFVRPLRRVAMIVIATHGIYRQPRAPAQAGPIGLCAAISSFSDGRRIEW